MNYCHLYPGLGQPIHKYTLITQTGSQTQPGLLQGCYKAVTWLLQGCSKVTRLLLQGFAESLQQSLKTKTQDRSIFGRSSRVVGI